MDLDLYVVTDETVAGGQEHEEIARMALAGGADVIQLRDKRMSGRKLLRTGRSISALTKASGALFMVNDRLDIALACGADGVHLGQGDLRVDTARQLAPRNFIIGVSVGSVEEARSAFAEGADYVAVSPVFATRTKDNAGPGLGLALIRRIRQETRAPLIAIGGIDETNVREVLSAGADGVAVISAVVGKEDIEEAARNIREIIREAKNPLTGLTQVSNTA
jgi:thiamine-phosphate pyrophosphorylase